MARKMPGPGEHVASQWGFSHISRNLTISPGHVKLRVSEIKNSAGLTGHVIRIRETRNA